MDKMETEQTKKGRVKETVRKSSRISKQAKPNPGLIAAKKNAMKNKKQPEFSFINDIYQIARDAKEMIKMDTGVVYDNKMTQHECIWDPNYPECPSRLTSIINRCSDLGLIEKCRVIEPRHASETEILTCHTPEHISLLKSTNQSSDLVELENISSKFDSVYFHPTTYKCSLLAAGCALQLVEEICDKKVQNGMALIRPPGHHAMHNEFNGYCFLNNAALAAKKALSRGMSRVLILDWDVHHGQGTQRIFYEDNRVLYISIHRYDRGTFWPNLRESEFDYAGSGPGLGYNINIPLNSSGKTDADYLAAFHHIIVKVAYQFQPELVIISAGFDAAVGCPEGEMEVTPACYAHLVSSMMSLANGRVAVLLEGGYCLKSLSESAALTLRALLRQPTPALKSLPPPCSSMTQTLLDVLSVHRKYWSCLSNVLAEYHCSNGEITNPDDGIWEYGHKPVYHQPMPRFEFIFEEDKSCGTFETRDCYPVQSKDTIKDLNTKLNGIIAGTKLLSTPHQVSFVYDVKMMDHKNFFNTDHIEKPKRILSIFKMHEEYNLVKRLLVLKSRSANEVELLGAHSRSHLRNMQSLSSMSQNELMQKKDVFQSVYFHQETFNAATLAAGCLLQIVDSVLTGVSRSGVAVVRPPGHHADIDEPCGFCIFNSVSVAARYAIEKYKLSRVLIVDWDVHHGNGTQEIFFEDSSVLYISVHRYDNGEFFPNTGDGAASLVGRGPGLGYNINIPWNRSGMGNAEYVSAFHHIILPIAYQFNPELVLVSAGFDAAVGDPLGGCKVSPEAFGHMTHWLQPLANGRIILSLEGGYNVNSISYSMTMCTKALLGDPLPNLKDVDSPCLSALRSLREVAYEQSDHWPCISLLKVKLPDRTTDRNGNVSKNEDGTCDLMQKLSLGDSSGGREEGGGKMASGGKPKSTAGGEKEKQGETSGSGSAQEQQQSAGSSSGQAQSGSSDRPNRPTLRDFLNANLEALQNEEMFAVIPMKTCPHLPSVAPVPPNGIDCSVPCPPCGDKSENWVCLSCYEVRCGRYVNEHMMMHNLDSGHPLTLSFSDLSVWCYPCQAYIDNEVLYAAKNAVHENKFGSSMVWSYGSEANQSETGI